MDHQNRSMHQVQRCGGTINKESRLFFLTEHSRSATFSSCCKITMFLTQKIRKTPPEVLESPKLREDANSSPWSRRNTSRSNVPADFEEGWCYCCHRNPNVIRVTCPPGARPRPNAFREGRPDRLTDTTQQTVSPKKRDFLQAHT